MSHWNTRERSNHASYFAVWTLYSSFPVSHSSGRCLYSSIKRMTDSVVHSISDIALPRSCAKSRPRSHRKLITFRNMGSKVLKYRTANVRRMRSFARTASGDCGTALVRPRSTPLGSSRSLAWLRACRPHTLTPIHIITFAAYAHPSPWPY